MYLVQILLPVTGERDGGSGASSLEPVRLELTERFGGLTAFTRSPAEGLWKESATARPERDDVVVLEVMTDELDRDWWAVYRQELERRFEQQEIVVRAQRVEVL